ncbi:hypothetical protein ACLOJK_005828 [Asimina triloba]
MALELEAHCASPPCCRHLSRQNPSSANDVHEEEDEGELTAGDTHHCRAIVAPIQVIHHDGNNEHILDPSRPQADDDHSGHTRQIFLTRHQQIHFHLAPIVAHFKSEPYHYSIWIFRGHGLDRKIQAVHHTGHDSPSPLPPPAMKLTIAGPPLTLPPDELLPPTASSPKLSSMLDLA